MRIALIGHGKMGKTIEKIAIDDGHEIVLIIGRDNVQELDHIKMVNPDVAIEFTQPNAARALVLTCLKAGVPVVSGTTGWEQGHAEAREMAVQHHAAFLQANNFSIGVNMFMEVSRVLAIMMKKRPEYQVSMREIHHLAKKDAPSGTAISLANDLITNIGRITEWVEGESKVETKLGILSERTDEVPGTHIIKYQSAIDEIEIIHTAHSREGFARGAIAAARFIKGKVGSFTMRDVISIGGGL
jgi:4-hydroxy-tetrahydrodipicolinate reductase